MRKERDNFYVGGTDILNLVQNGERSNNTSGCKGVSWDCSVNLWKAYIGFKGKRYYLGASADLEKAVELRKTAEKKMHGEFLEWYKTAYPDLWKKIERKQSNDQRA